MAYIGNQQTEGFSKIPPKQDLTGATGTTLTLSNAVSSPESIDLFINNVRQEPTESYTTDGTTVNLVGYSVAATDDIYVVYNSLAQQTSTHPSNQALQATTGTFSSNVDVGDSLLVDTIKEGTGTNTAITIDSSGRVNMDASYVFDQFELTADKGAAGDITSNLRRVQHSAFASVNGMTESSGVFSFPFTGLYRVEVFYKSSPLSNDNIVLAINATIDNSSYFQTSAANARGAGDQSSYCSALINVTDISLVKVKFNLASVTSGSNVNGSTSGTQTSFIFTRVAPAQ
jgi:hypothetical protein